MIASIRDPCSRVRRCAPYVYLFLVAMVAAGVHIARYTEFSPIDELRHVDYAMRASKLEFPNLGDLLTQDAMREEACRGLDLPFEEPPCDSTRFDPLDFRDDGYQTATGHPPPYYLGAGWFARAAEALGLSSSFLDPARVFSALMFAAGLMVAFAAGRMAQVRAAPLLAALTLLPIMPTVLHASSTVNPDSTAILVGAVVMLVGLGWERGRFPMWALAVAGAVATGTKFTSLLAVIVMGGVFAVRAVPVDRWRGGSSSDLDDRDDLDDVERSGPVRSARDYLRAALVLVGSAVLVAVLWVGLDSVRATIDPILVPQNQAFAADGIPRPGILFHPNNLFAWLPPHDGFDAIRFVTPYVLDIRLLTVYLFAGATLMAALRVHRRDTFSLIGAFGVVASLLGGPAFVVFTVVVSDVVVGPAARYGMSLLPFMAAVLASFVKGRVGLAAMWAFGLGSFALLVGTMLVS